MDENHVTENFEARQKASSLIPQPSVVCTPYRLWKVDALGCEKIIIDLFHSYFVSKRQEKLSFTFIYCTDVHFLWPAICQNCHLSYMRRHSFLRIAG